MQAAETSQPEQRPDEELMRLTQGGDRNAYGELFDRSRNPRPVW